MQIFGHKWAKLAHIVTTQNTCFFSQFRSSSFGIYDWQSGTERSFSANVPLSSYIHHSTNTAYSFATYAV